jgi:hypothetical protein
VDSVLPHPKKLKRKKKKNVKSCVEFGVLKAVVMKTSVFWDITWMKAVNFRAEE